MNHFYSLLYTAQTKMVGPLQYFYPSHISIVSQNCSNKKKIISNIQHANENTTVSLAYGYPIKVQMLTKFY